MTNRLKRVAGIGLAVAVVASAAPASAADFVVDHTDDIVDATPGDGSCATASGTCTVRAAIQEANALSGADTITMPAGIFKLSIPGKVEDAAATGDLDVTDDLTITGAGEDLTFIDGTPSDDGAVDRVFDIAPAAEAISVTIEQLTVQRGGGVSDGGGIRNQADLTIRDARLRWNSALDGAGIHHELPSATGRHLMLLRARLEDNFGSGRGGGIAIDDGSVTIIDSSVAWNTAQSGGAGLAAVASPGLTSVALTVARSTFNHNTAEAGNGGGLLLLTNAVSGTVSNTTIFGNRAIANNASGGGVSAQAPVNFNNVTIAHNTAGNLAGGFTNDLGTIGNSIIGDNTTTAGAPSDCGALFSDGYTLIEDVTGCLPFTTTGDVTGVDPNLAPLAFYGGLTRTAPPLAGSPAIDTGNPAAPTGAGTTCETTDQAGTARPISTACDRGAWEADGTEAVPTAPPGAQFIVTSYEDFDGWPSGDNDTNPGDGQCVTSEGTCTLRAALEEANALGGARVIYLPAGVYDDRQSVTGDNASLYGDFDVVSGATITLLGAGAQNTIINGRTAGDAVFDVRPGGVLTLDGVMVRRGSSNEGGGIHNEGTLTLQDAIVRDNFGNDGSGIFAKGTVIIDNSIVRDNRSNSDGGGLLGSGFPGPTVQISDSAFIDNVAATIGDGGGLNLTFGNATITSTTIAGNRAENGGGIHKKYGAGSSLTITDSTISGNTASYFSTPGSGGGINSAQTFAISNSTVSGNDAKTAGGGVYAVFGSYPVELTNVTITGNTSPIQGGLVHYSPAEVVNTIIAGNSDVQCADLSGSGSLISSGSNIGGDASCGFTEPTDMENTDPLLGPLADNGGPTKTHALLVGSPAIDAGNDASAPATDQRGVTRPQGPKSDIGAFEVEAPPSADLAVTKDNGQIQTAAGSTPTYLINAANGGPDDVTGALVTDTFDISRFDVANATWTCAPDGGAGAGTSCPASGAGADLVAGVAIDLEDGDAVTITLLAPVFPGASGSLTNDASIAHPTIADPMPGNNDNGDTDTLTAEADLSITKDDGASGVIVGSQTTYTITATNAGPSDAIGATVVDDFPAALSACSWTCSGSDGGVCAASDSGNLSESVDLPAGGSVTFLATCTVGGDGTSPISNTATVAVPAGVTELDGADNSATDENAGLGPCGFPNDPVVANQTITTMQDITGCQTVTLGDALDVNTIFSATAGTSVIFVGGVTLGGTVTIDIDPVLANP